MTKSIVEKERKTKIRLFKLGQHSIDPSMIKVKLNFIHDNSIDLTVLNINKTISKEVIKKYQSLFSITLIPLIEKLKIFELTVDVKIETMINPVFSVEENKYVHISNRISVEFDVSYKSQKLCAISSKYSNVILVIQAIEKFNINDFLMSAIDKISNDYKKDIKFVKSLCIINRKFDPEKMMLKNKHLLKIPKVYKNTEFYKNMNFVTNYIKKNNEIFKFPYHELTYDLSNDKFTHFFVELYKSKDYALYNQDIFEDNKDILKAFSRMNFFPFTEKEIDEMNEGDMLNNYEMLTY